MIELQWNCSGAVIELRCRAAMATLGSAADLEAGASGWSRGDGVGGPGEVDVWQ